ncbi:NAD(P)H-dependent oxidoreductase [Microbacterium radiodurans]|uniref:NAD(P)H-dependent oxidoreductase n=1 Tax=Microbacterium radiodurans TaxID=661398 RepID=A0A5J5ITH7_9MICO|nr:NAD(P)H-dependent oxidoreductase [Microbacterium radiodurans]KAA9089188.1 NAD(P)H-dependent oxidoreductase [Microbacterium radiodurans]
MSTLIVTAHPDPSSLTHAVATRLAEDLSAAHEPVEVADLAAEGFDPRFTLADRRSYVVAGEYPGDVAAEMARIDRADHLVLVFPVYWWSMPALLKGWIDRVFVNGWAFGVGEGDSIRPGMQRLTTHLVPIAASDAALYDRRGYDTSLRTQIENGIVDYCGSRRGVTAFLHESESEGVAARLDAVVAEVAGAIRG